jgi:hypothetical protein
VTQFNIEQQLADLDSDEATNVGLPVRPGTVPSEAKQHVPL